MELVNIPKEFSSRYVNDGFSGGEKKRMEVLQLAMLRPKIAVLDETDSGLDIDALGVVAAGVNRFATSEMGVLIITHYQRILHLVEPDFVHVMYDGRIVKRADLSWSASSRPRVMAGLARRSPREHELVARRWSLVARPGEGPGGVPGARARGPRPAGGLSGLARARSACSHRSRRSIATSAAITRTHRGSHTLSAEATAAFEGARATVADHIGAADRREVVFVRNATEAINLVAYAWGAANVGAGDRIVLTEMEHRTSFPGSCSPRELSGDRLVPIDDGALELDAYANLLERGPKLVAVAHVSNVLGTLNPLAEISRLAHEAGALVLADGAQAAPKLPLEISELGVDFYALTGHKAYGPTGIGALWARLELLREMPPFLGGGSMIRKVTKAGTTWADPPARFEAGTPAIAQAIGMAARCAGSTGSGSRRSPRTSARSPRSRSSA